MTCGSVGAGEAMSSQRWSISEPCPVGESFSTHESCLACLAGFQLPLVAWDHSGGSTWTFLAMSGGACFTTRLSAVSS